MSDIKSQAAQVTAVVSKAFADLEDVFADVNAAIEAKGKAEGSRATKRREIMDQCAALSLQHKFTDADIAAGVKAAVAAYKSNAIADKTLANLASDLKAVMHPKVRERLPALRKLASTVFDKNDKNAEGVRDEFKRADHMVARIAADVAADRVKEVPTTVAAATTIAAGRVAKKAESLSKAKAKIQGIIDACNAARVVFQLPQFDKIKTLCESLLEDTTLKDALAKAQTAKKNAGGLRKANGAAPAQGASNMEEVLGNAGA